MFVSAKHFWMRCMFWTKKQNKNTYLIFSLNIDSNSMMIKPKLSFSAGCWWTACQKTWSKNTQSSHWSPYKCQTSWNILGWETHIGARSEASAEEIDWWYQDSLHCQRFPTWKKTCLSLLNALVFSHVHHLALLKNGISQKVNYPVVLKLAATERIMMFRTT